MIRGKDNQQDQNAAQPQSPQIFFGKQTTEKLHQCSQARHFTGIHTSTTRRLLAQLYSYGQTAEFLVVHCHR